MMHLIFRVPGERLISFHTLSVARHYNMHVVHTTLLSEAPVQVSIIDVMGASIRSADRSVPISGPWGGVCCRAEPGFAQAAASSISFY